MKSMKLAVVVPVDPSEDGNRLRAEVWAKVTEILSQYLGKYYTRFNPAPEAWGKTVNGKMGIILGRENPVEFMDFLVSGKKAQNAAMAFHIDALLKNIDSAPVKVGDALIQTVVIDGRNSELLVHALWGVLAEKDVILPDFGVYFAGPKKAKISYEEEMRIFAHIAEHAISVVELAVKEEKDDPF